MRVRDLAAARGLQGEDTVADQTEDLRGISLAGVVAEVLGIVVKQELEVGPSFLHRCPSLRHVVVS